MSYHWGPTIVTDSLILYLDAGNSKSYPGSGNVWYDLSGNGYDGRGDNEGNGGYNDSNFPEWIDRYGGIFDFGNTKGIVINSDMGSHTEITHEMWVYKHKSAPNDYFSDGRNGTGQWHIWNYTGYNYNIDLHAALQYNDGDSYVEESALTYRWLHILWTSDSGGSQLFINSDKVIPDKSNSLTENIGEDFHIGCRFNGTSSFNGYIPIYKIYDRVLSNSEVLQNYNALKGRFGL